MIVTTIAHLNRYRGLSPDLDTAIDWILTESWKTLAPGRTGIDGDSVFALASAYETKSASEVRYEAHRKYIDIQMLAEGREFIMVRSAAGLPVDTPYVGGNDIEFLAAPDTAGVPADPAASPASSTSLASPGRGSPCGDVHRVTLVPGVVAFLFPEDAHKPCVRVEEGPEAVRKVVVKVTA